MTITNSRVRCVIFDKDGVLVDFHSMWVPWAENTVQLINDATAQDLTHDIYRTLGICPHTKKVGPGALAEKTLPLIRGDMMQMLKGKGYPHHEAEHISHKCVLEESQEGRIKSIVHLPPIFEELNNMGIHTAVCTSDSRRATDKQLEILGVADYAAVVMCGNDPGVKPKPDPHCALSICKQLGVEPHETIMVGDTATDLKMGRSAGLRASVAVLSGIGNRDTLKHWADHYINDVSELIQLIVDEWNEDTKRG